MVFILLQPLVVVLFDGIGPASINLAGGALPFLESLMATIPNFYASQFLNLPDRVRREVFDGNCLTPRACIRLIDGLPAILHLMSFKN